MGFPRKKTGALYAGGAAITNLWDTELDYVSASSQASNGGIENLNLVSEGELVQVPPAEHDHFNGRGLHVLVLVGVGPGGDGKGGVPYPIHTRDTEQEEFMKQLFRRATALVLALLVTVSTAAASEAMGWQIHTGKTQLSQGTGLGKNLFWSDTYSDLRAEYYLRYSQCHCSGFQWSAWLSSTTLCFSHAPRSSG